MLQGLALVTIAIHIVDNQLVGVDGLLEELDQPTNLLRREDRSFLLVVHPQDERRHQRHGLWAVPTPPTEHLHGVVKGDLGVVDEVQPIGGAGAGQQLGGV